MADLTAFPQLSTRRLLLREITEADSAALFAIHANPEVRRWFGSDPLVSEDEARALVRTFASWRELVNPATRWGLERRDVPGLVGTCGLFSWNRQWRKCSIGYEIAPAAGGQGLMQEALVAVIDWGFARMQLNRIEAQIHPDNLRSIRLVDKLGFVLEGRLREVARWGGRQHDMLMYSLLRSEWPRHRDGRSTAPADRR